MKNSQQCPKCHGNKIGRLDTISDRDYQYANSVEVRAFGYLAESFGERKVKGYGEMEAYVCGACGYVETYLKEVDPAQLESLAGFRWLSPGPAGNPYR